MSKPLARKCINCRTRAMAPAILAVYTLDREHDGRPYSVSVPNLEVLQCQNCQAIVLDDAAHDRIDQAMRAAAGLLSPAEIKQQREALGYTQQELADYLKISMYTLCRWETGAQIQQRAMDAFLRIFFQSAEARALLGAPVRGPSIEVDDIDPIPELIPRRHFTTNLPLK